MSGMSAGISAARSVGRPFNPKWATSMGIESPGLAIVGSALGFAAGNAAGAFVTYKGIGSEGKSDPPLWPMQVAVFGGLFGLIFLGATAAVYDKYTPAGSAIMSAAVGAGVGYVTGTFGTYAQQGISHAMDS